MSRRLAWLAALLHVAVLGTGCPRFSEEEFCAEHPRSCSLGVTELRPSRGPAAGGTRVVVSGNAFDPELQVEVGGVPAATTVDNAGQLSFITPPHAEGLQDVTLRGRFETVTFPRAFHYSPRPQATLFPSAGSSLGGTAVRLTGSDIGPFAQIWIGGTLAALQTKQAETELAIIKTPAMAPGVYDVEIRNGNGGRAVLPGAFRYEVPWVERNTGLPAGATVYALRVDPTNPEHLYAGTSSGLARSTNGGESWTLLPVAQVPAPVTRVQVSAGDPRLMYVATGNGVHRSRDAGATWEAVGLTASIRDLVVGPFSPVMLYALTEQGLWKSQDGGDTWSQAGEGLSNAGRFVSRLDVRPGPSFVVYASLGYSLYMREPEARAWTKVAIPNGEAFGWSMGTAFMSDGNRGLSLNATAMSLSTDGGASWKRVFGGPIWSGGGNAYLALALLDAPSDNLLVADTHSFYRATFSGDTSPKEWTFIGQGLPAGASILCIAPHPLDPRVVYVGTREHGVLMTTILGL